MRTGDLLAKMAKGQTLNSEEINELQLRGNRIDDIMSFVTGLQDNTVKLNGLRAGRVETDVPAGYPFFSTWFETDAAKYISVSNATWTSINFDNTVFTQRKDVPCVFRVSGAKLYPSFASSYIAFSGRVLWNTNATGARYIAIAYYDSTNTLIERRSMNVAASIGASAGTNVVLTNYRFAKSTLSSDPIQYMQIEVYQDSGGNLGMVAIDIFSWVAYR